MYVIRALAIGFGAASLFVAGIVTEKYRPFGGDYYRKNAIELANQIARMDAQRCCHD